MSEFVIPSQDTGPEVPASPAAPAVDPDQAPQAPADPAAPPQEPLLAGKFKTPADLEAAYKALESKLGQQPQKSLKDELADPQAKPKEAPQSLDMVPFQAEFARDGQLSDKSYEALSAKGLPKEIVDGYIAGQQALMQQAVTEITSEVGGMEAYQEMVGWAKGSLEAPDIQAYNEAMTSNQPARMKLAVKALQARFQESEGKSPHLAHGRSGSASHGFQSVQEMTAMQKDTRYLSGDPAFHKQFDAKLAASKF